MAHLSDGTVTLKQIDIGDSFPANVSKDTVWFIKMPLYSEERNIPNKRLLINDIYDFINELDSSATIAILSSPIFVANLLSDLPSNTYLKLWIGVKLKDTLSCDYKLQQQHAALVVITKHKESLRHSKTRISYTFCPFCEKTTKDYGGKKHLYHEYGTLMSDVWRDLEIDSTYDTTSIVKRLKDLFGVSPYKNLKIVDFSNKYLPTEISAETSIKEEDVSIFSYNGTTESVIVNGDCLEILKQIPDNSIDFCFADPPYNVDKKYECWDDAIDIQEYFSWCDKWLGELGRIIKPGKTVAVLNIPQWAVRHFRCLSQSLIFQDWIIWESLSVPVRMIMPAHYSIICFTKGNSDRLPVFSREQNSILETESLNTIKEFYCIRSSCINKRVKEKIDDRQFVTNLWWDIHRLKHNSRRVDHPTQLPPLLMRRLISIFTNEGDIVLDPFNGSGTTTLCAEQLNRKYFGIELSKKYYDISIQRHIEFEKGLDPFGKQQKTPNAKNSIVKRLKKQKYEVDKKTLQLEVKELSIKLNRVPTRDDVIQYCSHPIKYFDEYFINWGEVTAAVRTTGMQNVENKKDYDFLIEKNIKISR
jgi:site-specific DNA-methyltransferase (adenine-specific)